MAKKKITELLEGWMQDFGAECGYELARSEFVKEGGDWYLRVYVDRLENGVYGVMSTDDCEKVSRYLSDRLDEEDPIEQNYILEVSSPGLDRPLLTEKDFSRFRGEQIDVRLYEAIGGSKLLQGELLGLENGVLRMKLQDGSEIELPREKAAKINLSVIF